MNSTPKMHLFRYCLALILAAGLLSACGPAPQANVDSPIRPTPIPSIHLFSCWLGDIQAQCGTLQVYENRETNQGRKIDLKVAVIKTHSAHPAPDPIFYLAGGPGGSAIEDAHYAMQVLKTAVKQRDLVLVDQRGTGGSNQLTCPRSLDESTGQVPLDDTMVQELQDCLSQLDGDPAAYTTAWAMDDLDDVRAALGYEQINLYGESYGPIAEEVYLQRHGSHVRTMILEGVTLLDTPIFELLPRSSQEALDLLLARCQADSTCQSAYPNFDTELAAVIARLEKQPVELPLVNARTGQPVILTRDMLVLGIHGLLRNTHTAVMVPRFIHQLYQEIYEEIAQAVAPNFASDTLPEVWKIMNLTILCHENWAQTRPAETDQFSQGSYLTYEDVRRFSVPEQICAVMPRPQPAALYQPASPSSVPVLIISNQADAQNPHVNEISAKERYPDSLIVTAPGQGHGYTGIPCRDTFISDFIERGTTEGLDTGCLLTEPLPSFP